MPASSKPGPSYDLSRSPVREGLNTDPALIASMATSESLEYTSSNIDSDSYMQLSPAAMLHSSQVPPQRDSTETVKAMHLALLYLLTNPEEFQKAIDSRPPMGATTLAEWNAEYDNDSMEGGSTISTVTADTRSSAPLPYVVFADDAEVVLPQAHTASQLFGLERIEGIELEAAAGVPSLSKLFLRWLALMPGGDHLNMIDPPGLTIMRIAGGRYRVTAAHRVVWTWMNEFAAFLDAGSYDEVQSLEFGDLVSMTIVDVFETDNHGKLLSYCPTFDNTKVHKTNQTTEYVRKGASKISSILTRAQKSKAAIEIMKQAKNMAASVQQKVGEAAASYISPKKRPSEVMPERVTAQGFEQALTTAAEEAVNHSSTPPKANTKSQANAYISDDDDDTEKHEV